MKNKDYLPGKFNRDDPKAPKRRWLFIIIVLASLWFASIILTTFISFFIGSDMSFEAKFAHANIAVIPIKGEIATERTGSMFIAEGTVSSKVINYIKSANSDPSIKAIIFDINSPGGSAVASEEIMLAIKQSPKLKIALIRDLGTSGAYWAASAADEIIANRMSLVGSVGVVSSYLQFEGTLHKYGIQEERLVAGERKDIGSPFKEMTAKEREIFQSKIDKIHSYFISSVIQNRNLTDLQAQQISEGDFFLGEEAIGIGLVDSIGGKDEAIRLIERHLNITGKTVEYREKQGFFSSVIDSMSQPAFYAGQGIGYAIRDTNLGKNIGIRT